MLRRLFAYHAWANHELLDALARLDPVNHAAERATALKIVDHSYVVAQIFRGNLTGTPHGYLTDHTEPTPSFAALRDGIIESGEWYRRYVANLTVEDAHQSIAFTFTDGDAGYMSREEMLTHVAVHAGYHRGEVGRLLWSLSITPPWDTLAVFLHRTEPSRRQGHLRPATS